MGGDFKSQFGTPLKKRVKNIDKFYMKKMYEKLISEVLPYF